MWYFLIEHLRTAFRWFLSFFIFIEEYTQSTWKQVYQCYNFWPLGSAPQMLLYTYFNSNKTNPATHFPAWHRFLAKHYGTVIYHPPLVRFNFVIAYDPRDVRHVLKDNFNNYERNLFLPATRRTAGSSIFAANGHDWVVQRKTALTVISPRLIQESEPVFRAESLNLIGRMVGTFDFQQLIGNYAIVVFSRHAFDYQGSWESLEPFSQAVNQIADVFGDINYRSNTNPFWTFYYAYRMSDGFERVYDQLMLILKSFLEQVKDGEIDRYNILAKYREKNEYSERQIADIMLNLLIAGRDTLTHSLTCTVYLLSRHPEVEKRLMKEINSTFDHAVDINMKVTDKMPYLSNIISEVLRLYPPVSTDMRMAKQEDILPSNGYHIRPRDMVVVSSFATQRSELYWGDNSEVFNPDRWGKGRPPNVAPEGMDEESYFPFHYGPQVCLGMRLAYAELKYTLVMLYYHLHFDLVDPGPHQVEHKIISSFVGLAVKATARNRDA